MINSIIDCPPQCTHEFSALPLVRDSIRPVPWIPVPCRYTKLQN